ncbi:autotransporter outer membrane beta-barrel domain-containing protein [Salibacterium qingdaonense]|uniref:Uncharacterized protein n=1 Tax=Salibacterium qingdaonense TaxID=266892 RepID=A0A1I4Q129_9BACI|nr:hypothetical protein [Salibacterium qingdaonense]SFM33782.1 hypothetical protein SAMN04488054_13512 [Salibacterium qingdaonense]
MVAEGKETYINSGSWNDSSDVVVEVEDDEGNFEEYSRADGDMSSTVASFLYNNQGVIEGSDIQFSFNDNDDISGVAALSFNADNAGSSFNIPSSNAFDGLVVEGNEYEVNNVTVGADNVTIRHTVMNDLTVDGDDFTSEENTINGDLDVNGSDSEFNTTINGDVTVDGSASFSNVEFAASTTISGTGSVTLAGTIGDLDPTTVDADEAVNFSEVEDADFTETLQDELDDQDVQDAESALSDLATNGASVVSGSNVVDYVENVLEDEGFEGVTASITGESASGATVDTETGEITGSDNDSNDVTFELTKGDATSNSINVTFTIEPGEVTDLEVSSVASPITAGNSFTLDLDAVDANGNNVDIGSEEVVTVSGLEDSSNGSSADGISQVLDFSTESTVTTNNITPKNAAETTITVSVGDLEASQEITVEAASGNASESSLQSASYDSDAGELSTELNVKDEFGNTITGLGTSDITTLTIGGTDVSGDIKSVTDNGEGNYSLVIENVTSEPADADTINVEIDSASLSADYQAIK